MSPEPGDRAENLEARDCGFQDKGLVQAEATEREGEKGAINKDSTTAKEEERGESLPGVPLLLLP